MENEGQDPQGGEGQEGGGTPAAEPSPFDRAQLHPALRDMSPTEITELFETMATTIKTVQSQATSAARRDPMDELSGVPAHARPAEPPPARRTAPTKDQYKEMLDPQSEHFDPETAFRAFAEANYGGLVGDINARTIRGLFGTFRTEFPDFKDYEADVMQGLQGRDPASLSERDVLQTYLTAKGLRATMAERSERARKATTTQPPSPTQDKPKVADLTPLEEEIAHKMFRRMESDPVKRLERYREFAARDEKDGGLTVNVPVGGGKRA